MVRTLPKWSQNVQEWQLKSSTLVKWNLIWGLHTKFHVILTSFEKVGGSGGGKIGATLDAHHRLKDSAFLAKLA